MFFSIDGGDGAGKSTQVALLCQWLRQQGHEVMACRDPGSTAAGRGRPRHPPPAPRPAHRSPQRNAPLHGRPAQLVEELIRPALAAGKIVVSDRYLLANVVYQGYGGGLDVETLWSIGRVATGGLFPDLTIVLDMPMEAAAARIRRAARPHGAARRRFHARVREGFLAEAARRPEQIAVVDASRSVERGAGGDSRRRRESAGIVAMELRPGASTRNTDRREMRQPQLNRGPRPLRRRRA